MAPYNRQSFGARRALPPSNLPIHLPVSHPARNPGVKPGQYPSSCPVRPSRRSAVLPVGRTTLAVALSAALASLLLVSPQRVRADEPGHGTADGHVAYDAAIVRPAGAAASEADVVARRAGAVADSGQAESAVPDERRKPLLAASEFAPGDADAAGHEGEGNETDSEAHPEGHVDLREASSLNLPDNAESDSPLPVFGSADRMHSSAQGDLGPQVTFEGNAELRRRGSSLRAQRIDYWQDIERVEAQGGVQVEQPGTRLSGPSLQLQLDSGKGAFEQPEYDLSSVGGRGKAERMEFIGNRFLQLINGSFTSCKPDNEDWRVEAEQLDLDLENSQGVARHARLKVRDYTVARVPYLPFPLGDRRQSGFLSPTPEYSNHTGLGITIPYYFNLAPNYDLTLSPNITTKRGLRVGSEFRYLSRPAAGRLQLDWVPNDSETGRSRYSYDASGSFTRVLGWNGGWNMQGVSDDNYFVDYSRALIDSAERSLPREAFLTRSFGDWNMLVRALRYQNILEARQAPPYEKVPQLQLTNNQVDVHGFDISLLSDMTQFRSPLPGAVEGNRLVVHPSISYPLQGGGWFFTPKVGMHASHYELNDRATNRAISRVVPTLSLDTGLIMERDSQWLGEASIQTLEPRLFYVRTPHRDQGDIPVFDSAASDLSFAQLFSENAYTGHDRISDANHLTAALVSRQIEQATGVERLRLAAAQRFYFSSQEVTIPGQPVRVDRRTDLLFAASGDFRGGHSFNAGMQYAVHDKRVPRLNLSYRYRPGNRRLFGAGVRYQSKEYAQWDTSVAWPINNKWSILGRVNYSFLQQRISPTTGLLEDVRPGLVEGLVGLEYDDCCWGARLVLHRFVTTEQKATNRIYLQFDLRGLGSLGDDPDDILTRNIPGYSRPNNDLTPAVRHFGYE
ncbi:MAG: LPS-assembly protein LptD [Lautropia sp.]|nr:LPS-assembly protein LptD [Lautropia sp.]